MIWIGVDAHKRLHQAVAISERGIEGERTFPNTTAAWAELLRWAGQWPERIWAVERTSRDGPARARLPAKPVAP